MPSLGDRFGDEAEKRNRAIRQMVGVFEVATVTPDFTVYLNGSPDAVPGWYVPDLMYIVGTTGMYLHVQGQPPLCIPTA